MKRSFLSFCISAGLAVTLPAAAQNAVPLAQAGGSAGVAGAELAPDAGNAGSAMAVATGSSDERRACKRVVVVDDIPHSWDKLERGTDAAWIAYSAGDYPASVPVFARLAKLGHPVAQWLMGNVYFFGQGVPLDYRMALQWFEKAALQGCFAAYGPTAKLYEQGSGTGVDLGKAYMWYNIAAAQLVQGKERQDLVALREKVAAMMTPGQIETAQKRSVQFVPRPVVPPDLSELPDSFFKEME